MFLPIEKLRNVTTLVTHVNCSDGTASAMIVKDVLPYVDIKFVQYDTPKQLALEAKPGMLFCDMSPPTSRVQEFIDCGAMVLDHHKKIESTVRAFGENGIFADEVLNPGVAGALLAFEHVWKPLAPEPYIEHTQARVEHFAKVASVRDTWSKTSPLWEESLKQHEALMFLDYSEWLHGKGERCFDFDLTPKLQIGGALLKKKARTVKTLASGALRCMSNKGTRLALVQEIPFLSDVAEAIQDVDVVIGWTYYCEEDFDGGRWFYGKDYDQKPKLMLSFRSKGYDVGALAAELGGGGHTRASGASTRIPKDSPNPYHYVRGLINQLESKLLP